ncbi:MAG: tripartite tricarboxylate transporter substrate binding protein [Rhodoplanes sp.]|uniref:Bug family tripartite tricarboxylate transporter substrate binding protein n=1 Tax=Rhodoplanes sp. TaxID=1968906 RepID=UPI0017E3E845|nr:tripartite tricarboxylate transporter substrate binding protein [Rhodoplanes sp.]NVO13239.1 tripartite tricarboxylate transporter substrate binding protein [Rhodoplanes sp.]
MKRTVLALLSAASIAVTGLAVTGMAARAQDKYPSKPVKIIVPYAPGGATDIVARVIGEHMRQDLGQSFVVENKPGAFGIIAIEEMARAKPDGYTVMIGNVSTNAITPVLFPKKFKIDYEKDVVPVTRLVDIPEFMVATTKDFPPTNVKDLVDFAKKNPGKVRYGSVGVGSYPHYDAALFAKRAGDLDMIAIHNKAGASGVINDLVSGDTQFSFLNVASTAPMVKAGNLRAMALVNHTRLPEYPDVATMQELGFPGVGTIAWQALFAPAGTPPEVLDTLFKAAVKAMQAPAVQEAFKKQNFNIVPNTSIADAKTWLADEMATWRKITNEVKIELSE